MRILFVTGDAHLPQIRGGVQSSTEQLISHVRSEGHDGAVACTLRPSDFTTITSRISMKLRRRRFSHEFYNGYSVYRSWDILGNIEGVVASYRPDVAVVQHNNTVPLSCKLLSMRVPVVIYMRNVEFGELDGRLDDLADAVKFIANSNFTRLKYEQEFGIQAHVIPPLVDPQRYKVVSDRKNVTFINPIPLKGLNIAVEVAKACPDIPFNFVENWAQSREDRERLRSMVAEIPNVDISSPTEDMRSIYKDAAIVLAPSVWEEAWGRVATEAQVSGIPVIGSRQGGLPEAIGPGGITLDITAPISEWTAALRDLWSDEAKYMKLSAQALQYAGRDDLKQAVQVKRFIEILHSARVKRT